MYQLIAYIQFLLKSKNEHSVHSPFVFDLVTKCFYDTYDYPDYLKLKQYRRSLLNNPMQLDITEVGSGSRVFASNKRAIKEIAKTSGTSLKRAKLLYRLMRYFKAKKALELGTSLGIGTHAMALGNPKASITSIEGCPEIHRVAKEQLRPSDVDNLTLINGLFSDVVPTLSNSKWDLVFIDGHHDKNATLGYFEQLLVSSHNDSVFILDDIHWSKGMTEAWETIKSHPKVTVSIDTFFWGFVFFRKEQAKEHFTIRL